MFGISLSEFFVIFVIGAILVRPKDLPGIVKAIRKAHQYLLNLKKEFLSYYNQFHNEVEEIESETKYIIDQTGTPQIAYDVSELEELRSNKKSNKKQKDLTEMS